MATLALSRWRHGFESRWDYRFLNASLPLRLAVHKVQSSSETRAAWSIAAAGSAISVQARSKTDSVPSGSVVPWSTSMTFVRSRYGSRERPRRWFGIASSSELDASSTSRSREMRP